jgi:hypothetical protein
MTTPADRLPEGRASTGCEFFTSVAAELALGSLAGAERSAAIAHVDQCEPCRTLVEGLSATADSLLLAAPETDPPAGYEVRLLARLNQADVPAHSTVVPLRRRTRAVLAVAAACLALAGAGVGLGLAVSPRSPAPLSSSGSLRMATLHSVGAQSRTVGEVVVTKATPSWVLMTLDRPGWSGWVTCLVTTGGRSEKIGSFYLDHGAGSWAVRLPSSPDAVTSARVTSSSGVVFATASFAS